MLVFMLNYETIFNHARTQEKGTQYVQIEIKIKKDKVRDVLLLYRVKNKFSFQDNQRQKIKKS